MSLATFCMALFGVLLNAGAQLLLKAGTNALAASGAASGVFDVALRTAFQPWIVAGLGCYVVSVAVWILVLSRAEVSVAYPLLSIGYVVNAFAAWQLFGEVLTATRLGGIAAILVGVWLITRP